MRRPSRHVRRPAWPAHPSLCIGIGRPQACVDDLAIFCTNGMRVDPLCGDRPRRFRDHRLNMVNVAFRAECLIHPVNGSVCATRRAGAE
jgi:hypothetical protein